MQQAQLIPEPGRVKCRMTSSSRNVLLSMEKYCFLKELHILNVLKLCHIKRTDDCISKPGDVSLEYSKKHLC